MRGPSTLQVAYTRSQPQPKAGVQVVPLLPNEGAIAVKVIVLILPVPWLFLHRGMTKEMATGPSAWLCFSALPLLLAS